MNLKVRKKVVLVFGENDNDRSALIEIARAIRPDSSAVFEKRRKPLVLLRASERPETRRKTAEEIAALVQAANVISDVVAVIVHRDCDAVEPAHLAVATELETALRAAGVQLPLPATPAFEIEAWWMLFPQALQRVCANWRPLNLGNRNVGSIPNAKEYLIHSLRPNNRSARTRVHDFRESDGVYVARNAREMGLITANARRRCASFDAFCKCIANIPT